MTPTKGPARPMLRLARQSSCRQLLMLCLWTASFAVAARSSGAVLRPTVLPGRRWCCVLLESI